MFCSRFWPQSMGFRTSWTCKNGCVKQWPKRAQKHNLKYIGSSGWDRDSGASFLVDVGGTLDSPHKVGLPRKFLLRPRGIPKIISHHYMAHLPYCTADCLQLQVTPKRGLNCVSERFHKKSWLQGWLKRGV